MSIMKEQKNREEKICDGATSDPGSDYTFFSN